MPASSMRPRPVLQRRCRASTNSAAMRRPRSASRSSQLPTGRRAVESLPYGGLPPRWCCRRSCSAGSAPAARAAAASAPAASYQTLSTDSASAAPGPHIRAVFAPGMTLGELKSLLAANQLDRRPRSERCRRLYPGVRRCPRGRWPRAPGGGAAFRRARAVRRTGRERLAGRAVKFPRFARSRALCAVPDGRVPRSAAAPRIARCRRAPNCRPDARSAPQRYVVVTVRNPVSALACTRRRRRAATTGVAPYAGRRRCAPASRALAVDYHLREMSSWPIRSAGRALPGL